MTHIEVYQKQYTGISIVTDDNRVMKLAYKHRVYTDDMVRAFEFYYSAVQPVIIDGWAVVDYSIPRFHEVIGYDLHPILFPSIAVPVCTPNQYIDFAKLKEGDVVLDLGAYSGLSSIMFSDKVGNSGRVIAVEPDPTNIRCASTNLKYYQRLTGKKNIGLLQGAAWEHNDGIELSAEESIGSTAVRYVGRRSAVANVKSFTLSKIMELYKLKEVDFIKCDIEGGETVVFKDLEFFKKHKPKIIIEPHNIFDKSVVHECVKQMSALGYRVRLVKQGAFLEIPLLECYP